MRGHLYPAVLVVLTVLTILAFLASLTIGPAGVGFTEALQAMFSGDGGTAVLIMREIRLPRAILGLAIGATLGLSGAALQGYLRNPLAEPGIIGVSGAAALGAVIAFYSGFSLAFPLALPLCAILGALIAVALLQLLAGSGGNLTLILAGVAIASLSGALTALALNLSPNPFAVQEIVFWMLGSITDRSLVHVALALPFMILGWLMILPLAPRLDVMSLGEETAQSLGVNLSRTRLLLVLGTAISVGAATAVSGVIGFVGLVVPHILRPLVGRQPSRLLPASALGGAFLLLSADVFVRVVSPASELKLGVVTALIGAPFFLSLILRTRWAYL
jgi:iron complex transport system permease protein